MVYVAVAVSWLVVGAAVGVIDARLGHWRHSWVVSAILGPFPVALAWERRHHVEHRGQRRPYPSPWPEEEAARVGLAEAVASLEADFGITAGSVILAGAPADALERDAVEEGYEVLVIGCRGGGLTKLVLGSCASRLACEATVPVMLVPAAPATSSPSTATTSKASGGGEGAS